MKYKIIAVFILVFASFLKSFCLFASESQKSKVGLIANPYASLFARHQKVVPQTPQTLPFPDPYRGMPLNFVPQGLKEKYKAEQQKEKQGNLQEKVMLELLKKMQVKKRIFDRQAAERVERVRLKQSNEKKSKSEVGVKAGSQEDRSTSFSFLIEDSDLFS